jgi:hypothetical protein
MRVQNGGCGRAPPHGVRPRARAHEDRVRVVDRGLQHLGQLVLGRRAGIAVRVR